MNASRFLGALSQAPRRALVALLRAYRLVLSPWLGNQCRFYPTCSAYGIEALQRHGALAGSYLAVARVLRCHPWCEGGCDPVPADRPRLFSHLLAKATVPEQALPSSLNSSSRPQS